MEYAHNSTALAGNSLTLEQTRAILDAVNPPEHFPQDGENYPASEDETPHQDHVKMESPCSLLRRGLSYFWKGVPRE